MKQLLIFFCLCFQNNLFAQRPAMDSSCPCRAKTIIRSPDLPPDQQRNGTVIVAFIQDSTGIFGNERIIQSIGPEYDKEALRAVRELNLVLNNCLLRCKNRARRPAGTYRQPITFTIAE